jgi:hypothetical protein
VPRGLVRGHLVCCWPRVSHGIRQPHAVGTSGHFGSISTAVTVVRWLAISPRSTMMSLLTHLQSTLERSEGTQTCGGFRRFGSAAHRRLAPYFLSRTNPQITVMIVQKSSRFCRHSQWSTLSLYSASSTLSNLCVLGEMTLRMRTGFQHKQHQMQLQNMLNAHQVATAADDHRLSARCYQQLVVNTAQTSWSSDQPRRSRQRGYMRERR